MAKNSDFDIRSCEETAIKTESAISSYITHINLLRVSKSA